MRQQLSIVHRMQPVFTFGLDHNSAVHDQISPEAALKPYLFVDERHRLLALNLQAQLLQFIRQAGLVRRLQQPRSELAMDLDRGANDFAGQVVAGQGKRLPQRTQSKPPRPQRKSLANPILAFLKAFFAPFAVYFASFAVKSSSGLLKLKAYPTANVTTVPIATYQVHGTFVKSQIYSSVTNPNSIPTIAPD